MIGAGGAPVGTGVAVVLVTHDTRTEVLAALDSLDADGIAPPHGEVVVVDTGSRDGTTEAVRRAWPGVRVLPLANTGFARAANAGLRATDAPTVVVANADVRFQRGAIATLARTMACDPGLAAVGPEVRYLDGTRQASARRRPDATTAVLHAVLGRIYPDNPWTRRYHARDLDPTVARDVDWLSGCALALRRAAVDAVGGFDPGYFLYVEDVDLAERLREAGWRLRYEPGARVRHRVGASTSRARWRALGHHARSLDRYLTARLRGPARLLRPLLPVAVAAWAATTGLAERYGRHRSTTGERRGRAPHHDRGR